MMLNKMPPNTSINSVLSHLENTTKWGARNRALFAFRQVFRIRDISALRVADVLNLDTSIRKFYIAEDGTRFELTSDLQDEVHRYLISKFNLTGNSLEPLIKTNLNVPLFPTQKRAKFSNNTLAQHYSLLDKNIRQHFTAVKQATKKPSMSQRLLSSFAG